VVVAEAVGVAVEGHDDGAVQEPVQESGGHGGVPQDLTPGNWNWLRFLIAHLPLTCGIALSACPLDLEGLTGVC
jgi:hypothetical protein